MTERALKILFFTPHVAIWAHTAPEALLARSLAAQGHDVEYLTCGRAQSYCAAMSAQGLAPDRTQSQADRICRACVVGTESLRESYGFVIHSLANLISSDDRAECSALAAAAARKRCLETRVEDIDVGRLALYEFTLAHKKMSTELTDIQWSEYEIYLRNALLSLRGFSRYMERAIPNAIATFSPQYSNINPCMQYAIARGVRVLFMESGTNLGHRLGTMRVWDWKVHRLVNPALRHWGQSDWNPVTQESAAAVIAHFRQLLSGQHFAVFSVPYAGSPGIRNKWPVRPEQRILLLTLSSYDEAYAALLIGAFPGEKVFSRVFRTQAEWVKATIAWAAARSDLFLVIRVHPRDFPNKRDQIRSEQSFVLEGLLRDVPANVHVNWPAQGVSLYELLEDTDVILTGWSVTALEGLILGIPVVTYDAKLPSYPSDIMWTGHSEQEYFANIDAALGQGWSFRNVTNGFRWLAYNFVTCTVTASKTFGRHELAKRGQIDRLATRLRNRLPRLGHALDLRNWRDAEEGARVISVMLAGGGDSIPEVRGATREGADAHGDAAVVTQALAQIHDLLYSNSNLPDAKQGLSSRIRGYLDVKVGA